MILSNQPNASVDGLDGHGSLQHGMFGIHETMSPHNLWLMKIVLNPKEDSLLPNQDYVIFKRHRQVSHLA